MKRILRPAGTVYVADAASVAGHEEHAGPLGAFYDLHGAKDDTFGMPTWEAAESEMQRMAVNLLLGRRGIRPDEVRAVFAGDLLNQCTGSSYGLLPFGMPFFGLFGACSTAAEGLVLGALLCGAYGGRFVTASSSHYCSAERQFRFPMEYGGQRTPTAQWTVTGAGAFLLSGSGADCAPGRRIRLTEVMAGAAVDRGIRDAANMGAAMAPAALDTLLGYLTESGRTPDSFDLIATGDLGREGAALLSDFARAEGVDIRRTYRDCGMLVYDAESTDKHAGGSGCGCSAIVTAAYILDRMRAGELSDVLVLGTGALMSPMSVQQGQSIPGIAHLIRLTAEEDA